jgi:hypothetical protein
VKEAMSKIKVSFFLAGIVCVFCVSVASASAAHFKTEKGKYPVKVLARGTNNQGFEIAGATAVCKTASFKGELSAESETLELHPEYSNCFVELAGIHTAVVKTNACNYMFHAALEASPANADIVGCASGSPIEIEVQGITGCFIEIGNQEGLKSVQYVNGKIAPKKVQARAEVNNIAWSTTAACKLAKETGAEAHYREGVLKEEGGKVVKAELAAAGKPATATAEDEAKAEGIEVS